MRGKHALRDDVVVVPVEEIEIPAAPGLQLQMDGDAFPGGLPAKISVSEHKLEVLVP